MEVLNKVTSRRTAVVGLMAGGAAMASMGQLAGCSSTTGVLPAVIDVVMQAVSVVCKVVPAVQTLVDIIVAAFPAAAGVATITDALAAQIAQYFCSLMPASHKLGAPVVANVNNKSVTLHYYAVVNGSLSYI